MIYYLLMLCIPVCVSCQSVMQKKYTLRYEKTNPILFSAITSLIALCFFVITSGLQLDFTPGLIPYSLAFAVAYAAAWVGTVMAVQYGLMAISTLIISCSLIFPTAYGIIMGEALTTNVVIGVILLFASLVLVNLKFNQKGKFSVKWLVWVLVAFAGNGVCSISQNMQKHALGDSYTHEFMIIALSASFLLLMLYVFFTSKDIKADFKACLPYSTVNGVCNAIGNFLILVLIGNIPNTILYPTNSALQMTGTFLLSYFLFKERFSLPQYIGYALGVASIVLLNI